MKTVNIHDAKTHLSKLVDAATKGEPFVIAKAGKPLVKVSTLGEVAPQRLGFMVGKTKVPADFDDMFAGELEAMFAGDVAEPSATPSK